MDHKEALDLILANACVYSTDKEGYCTYVVTLHCYVFQVEAKPLGDFKYEIRSCKKFTGGDY